jgi:hypothetical protein
VKKVSSIKERIKEFAENTGENKDLFFEKIGVTSANFRGKKLQTGVNADLIEKIVSIYPDIDLQWLITGKEKSTKENYDLLNEEKDKYETLAKGIPYYDVEFESGFDFLENNQSVLPTNYINHPFFSSSEFVVRNSGQSMAKVIKHGDAIGMVHLKHWREFLAFGEIYALVLKDNRRLIKVITKGDTPDTFTLLSKPTDNKKEEFPPQQIKKSFITNVFKVEAYSGKF